MKRTPMTLRGAEALRAELKRLKSEERPSVIKAIAEARGHGDLSENAEYHAAREQQGFIEGRIGEIEAKLVDRGDHRPQPADDQRGKVVFGATVELEDQDDGKQRRVSDRRRGRGRHQCRPHLHHFADRAGAGGQIGGRRRRRRRPPAASGPTRSWPSDSSNFAGCADGERQCNKCLQALGPDVRDHNPGQGGVGRYRTATFPIRWISALAVRTASSVNKASRASRSPPPGL